MSNHTEDDAAFCQRVLGGEERVDEVAALTRFRSRRPRSVVSNLPLGWVGALAAVAIVALLVTTPLGSFAQNFLTIFQPKTFAPIDITALKAQGKLLPNLNDFGTLARARGDKPETVGSLATASKIVGFRVLGVAAVPAGIPASAKITVNRRVEQSFRFSAAKARASAARRKRPLPTMPANLDGAMVTASIGPTVITRYGSRSKSEGGPILLIVQSVAPVVRSRGASLGELESYLLSMPGISPELATQIRAIGDASALPVPFLATKQTAQSVTVRGANGVEIGDNTGLGAGVVWQTDGKVYAVFGTLAQSEILNVANSLR
jgi:hypothetical protein